MSAIDSLEIGVIEWPTGLQSLAKETNDAGYDLPSDIDIVISPGERVTVSTGIRLLIPYDYWGKVYPRSGMASKQGVDVGAGVIDPSYTGIIKVVIFNHGKDPLTIRRGDRIAQLIFHRRSDAIMYAATEEDVKNHRSQSHRMDKGFGSSGQ